MASRPANSQSSQSRFILNVIIVVGAITGAVVITGRNSGKIQAFFINCPKCHDWIFSPQISGKPDDDSNENPSATSANKVQEGLTAKRALQSEAVPEVPAQKITNGSKPAFYSKKSKAVERRISAQPVKGSITAVMNGASAAAAIGIQDPPHLPEYYEELLREKLARKEAETRLDERTRAQAREDSIRAKDAEERERQISKSQSKEGAGSNSSQCNDGVLALTSVQSSATKSRQIADTLPIPSPDPKPDAKVAPDESGTREKKLEIKQTPDVQPTPALSPVPATADSAARKG